jgi:hypothetical protein
MLTMVFLYAQDNINEESLFSDPQTVESSSNIMNNTINSNVEKQSVTLSGQISAYSAYTLGRDFVSGKTNGDKNSFQNYIRGNLFLDIRLTKGIKTFANLEADYSPLGQLQVHRFIGIPPISSDTTLLETNNTALILKEFFLDANVNRMVYFRVGKQVLQWGTAYFWNPSDLINVQKKDFNNLSFFREGGYGLKTHIPFGTVLNLYNYLDLNNVSRIENVAAASKIEALIGGTELSLSIWAKKDFHPVYALDFTSRVFGIDIRGEASLADWDSHLKVKTETITVGPLTVTNIVTSPVTNQWTPKISLGFTKSFDFLEVSDRISVTGEFFYNGAGYSENIFANDTIRNALLIGAASYSPNYNSQFYAAIFTSIVKFFSPDLTFNFNAIGNLNDYSFTLAPALMYNPADNFNLTFTMIGYVGNENCEYTFFGSALTFSLQADLRF